MIRRPPRSTLSSSSAASDVYKRQHLCAMTCWIRSCSPSLLRGSSTWSVIVSEASSSGFDPVVFDLDGTVVDTVELIVESFRFATRTVLGEVLPDGVIIAGVGQPLMFQMERLSEEHAQEL